MGIIFSNTVLNKECVSAKIIKINPTRKDAIIQCLDYQINDTQITRSKVSTKNCFQSPKFQKIYLDLPGNKKKDKHKKV